jgi:hypothetical protein
LAKIVISQPFFFPWVGLFEQIRLADVYVHFDDAQFPLGRGRSFINRVEVKTPHGAQWLTVPVLRPGLQLISEVVIGGDPRWRDKHIKTLTYNYSRTPFFREMMEIAESVFGLNTESLAAMNIYAIERISAYFGLGARFCLSSSYGIKSSSSAKVLELVQRLNGNVYITGHGAKNYLDHELFERNGIRVEYMDYQRTPYPQLYGEFNPHVSILDLIGNVGRAGVEYIHSSTKYWKEFLRE